MYCEKLMLILSMRFASPKLLFVNGGDRNSLQRSGSFHYIKQRLLLLKPPSLIIIMGTNLKK